MSGRRVDGAPARREDAPAGAVPEVPCDLVLRARELVRGAAGRSLTAASPARLAAYHEALASRRGPAPELVLPTETAVELGSPQRHACHAVLWTHGEIADGRATLRGLDLNVPGHPDRDYAQIVILRTAAGVPLDLTRAEALQFLTRRLPGVMARALPGRLWLRVSHEAVAAGIDFALVAAALRRSYREELPEVTGVECLFATDDQPTLEGLVSIATEWRIRTGRHPRLRPDPQGGYECVDLSCDACDERPVCDRIREVASIRRLQREAVP